MTEYGIFCDEGCIEAGFYSAEDAAAGMAAYPDDECWVDEMCPEADRGDQARGVCETCNGMDDDT